MAQAAAAGLSVQQAFTASSNFCSFPVALQTLFGCATGESWNGIMHDLMVTPERGEMVRPSTVLFAANHFSSSDFSYLSPEGG